MRQCQHEKLPFGKFQQIIQLQMALAFLRCALAARQQLAEPAISFPVARIDENIRRAVDENETSADQQSRLMQDVGIPQFLIGAHHAGHRVAVGDADDGKPQFAGLMHIVLRMRAAAQEREIGGDADFGIDRDIARMFHANSPCTNHFGGTAVPPSSTTSS